jgi:hypothetical protein
MNMSPCAAKNQVRNALAAIFTMGTFVFYVSSMFTNGTRPRGPKIVFRHSGLTPGRAAKTRIGGARRGKRAPHDAVQERAGTRGKNSVERQIRRRTQPRGGGGGEK